MIRLRRLAAAPTVALLLYLVLIASSNRERSSASADAAAGGGGGGGGGAAPRAAGLDPRLGCVKVVDDVGVGDDGEDVAVEVGVGDHVGERSAAVEKRPLHRSRSSGARRTDELFLESGDHRVRRRVWRSLARVAPRRQH